MHNNEPGFIIKQRGRLEKLKLKMGYPKKLKFSKSK